MAKSKGTNLLHMRGYVLSTYGPEAWENVVRSLSKEDAQAVLELTSVGWYDVDLQLRLLRAIDRVLGTGDLRLIPSMARYEAEKDLTGAHRLFARMANPGYLLEKSGDYWRRFYDTGRWEVARSGDSATGTLLDFAVADKAFCFYLGSYIQRMFQFAGAKHISVDHPKCRANGDRVCLFAGSWK
ncbi:MAG TPA: hypothetical protein VI072_18120 [Polyangiaceae bacterium]